MELEGGRADTCGGKRERKKEEKSGSDVGLLMLIPTSLYGNPGSAHSPLQPDFLSPRAAARNDNRHACTTVCEQESDRESVRNKK